MVGWLLLAESSSPGRFGNTRTGQLDWGFTGWIWWKHQRAGELRILHKEWLKRRTYNLGCVSERNKGMWELMLGGVDGLEIP